EFVRSGLPALRPGVTAQVGSVGAASGFAITEEFATNWRNRAPSVGAAFARRRAAAPRRAVGAELAATAREPEEGMPDEAQRSPPCPRHSLRRVAGQPQVLAPRYFLRVTPFRRARETPQILRPFPNRSYKIRMEETLALRGARLEIAPLDEANWVSTPALVYGARPQERGCNSHWLI
ncbi:MAG: hypothetical protein BJ554DRAFT_8084, partial [Olpidium bornovanus]